MHPGRDIHPSRTGLGWGMGMMKMTEEPGKKLMTAKATKNEEDIFLRGGKSLAERGRGRGVCVCSCWLCCLA